MNTFFIMIEIMVKPKLLRIRWRIVSRGIWKVKRLAKIFCLDMAFSNAHLQSFKTAQSTLDECAFSGEWRNLFLVFPP